MAQMVTASIYAINATESKSPAGFNQISFPVQNVLFRSVSPAITYSGVACNAFLQLLPTSGSSVSQPQYFTSATVYTLAQAAG